MTTLALDVLDVKTVRPRSDRAALSYLKESGAVPICIIERDGGGKFSFGKLNPAATITYWIASKDARAVVVLARKIAGRAPDFATAEAAIIEAARQKRATLTSGQVAIERASVAAGRLNVYFEQMRKSGQLQVFNQIYRRRRLEAVACGRGFMSWSCAMARLRSALIPLLIGGGQPAAGSSLFAEVFR
jgi:hypothetical protein